MGVLRGEKLSAEFHIGGIEEMEGEVTISGLE